MRASQERRAPLMLLALVAASAACGANSNAPAQDDAWRIAPEATTIIVAGEPPKEAEVKPQGEAQCGWSTISRADLGVNYDDRVPRKRSYGAKPVAGKGKTCGDRLETAALRMLNCERQARDLPPLQCDMRMVWMARAHSKDMIARRFFSHVNPDGVDPFRRLKARGALYWSAAENIAMNPTVAGGHNSWMNSSGHRRNILHRKVTHAGVGVVRGPEGLMLTQLFIKPR